MMKQWWAALVLLRFPFGVLLMPVFWLALIIAPQPIPMLPAVGVFLILHLLIFPASNGYNSWFDRDEGPIGGLERPPKVPSVLIYLVATMDGLAIFLGFVLFNWLFALLLMGYVVVSRSYSWPGLRLKASPLWSTLVVAIFQGGYTIIAVIVGLGMQVPWERWPVILATCILFTGSYPISQIFQHEEDAARGDRTLSLVLGIRGTLIWSGACQLLGFTLLMIGLWDLLLAGQLWGLVFAGGLAGIIFSRYAAVVWLDPSQANYKRTMAVNMQSSLLLSAGFISVLVQLVYAQ